MPLFMLYHLYARLQIFCYFTLEEVLSHLLPSVVSSLSFREHIVSRVVYEIILWRQKSRADAGHTGTRDEISDKCLYYQIKHLNAQDKSQ